MLLTTKMSQKKSENNLIGMTVEESEKRDKFLSQISRIAHPVDKAKVNPVKSDSKYKSRFFFKVTDTDEISIIEDSVHAKLQEDPINIEIVQRSDKYAKELPAELKSAIVKIREFFLKEIAPKSIALQGGLAQAKAVIEQQVGEVDASEMMWAEKFAAHSAKLRVLRFIKSLFELTDDEAEKLYELTCTSKQNSIIMFPQSVQASDTVKKDK